MALNDDSGQTQEACPRCGANKKWCDGKWGTKFLGCSRYPACKWASWRKDWVTPQMIGPIKMLKARKGRR